MGFPGAARASLLLALTALLVGGCGDSDDGSAEVQVETGSLTKAEFVEEANAICRRDRREFEREFARFVRNSTSAGQGDAAAGELVETVVVPVYSEQIDQIGELGAPSGDEEEVTAFLEALQEGLDDALDQPLAFTGDKDHFIEAAELASAYGLTVCAQALV